MNSIKLECYFNLCAFHRQNKTEQKLVSQKIPHLFLTAKIEEVCRSICNHTKCVLQNIYMYFLFLFFLVYPFFLWQASSIVMLCPSFLWAFLPFISLFFNLDVPFPSYMFIFFLSLIFCSILQPFYFLKDGFAAKWFPPTSLFCSIREKLALNLFIVQVFLS